MHLQALSKNENKTVSHLASELLERANKLTEPYNFNKKLEHPKNIHALYAVYHETISLIEQKLL